MAVDILLKLEGLEGESRAQRGPPRLAPLLAELRQGSGRYVLTSVAHGARSPARQQALPLTIRSTGAPMPRHCHCYNVVFADGSVRALQPDGSIALAEMAQALRRAGTRARAFALGVQGASLGAVLTALRAQGVWVGTPSVQPGGGPTPALLVVADGAPAQPRGPGLLFLSAPPGTPVPLLLPAVQCAREAARRIMPSTGFEAVLVQQASAGPSEQLALNFEHIHPV